MKNVVLVGDSIRLGYDRAVQKSLEGRANVLFSPDNCRFAAYVLRYIHEYIDLCAPGRCDLLHWNTGLWDCLRLFGEEPHTPLEVYTYYIDRICRRLRRFFPDMPIIFATSTSVRSEKMSPDFKRYNEEIEIYNAAAVEVVRKYDMEVNDLYALSRTLPDSAHSDNVHYYTPYATERFTRQVLDSIAPHLGITEELPYREVLYVDKPIGI